MCGTSPPGSASSSSLVQRVRRTRLRSARTAARSRRPRTTGSHASTTARTDACSRRWRVTAIAFVGPGTMVLGTADGHVLLSTRGALNPLATTSGRVLGLSTGGGRFLVRLANELRVYTDSGKLVSTIQTKAQHAVLSPGGL